MRHVSRVKKDNNQGIVLLSGGIDSAVTLYLAQKYGYKLHALLFRYGQKHQKETECAKQIARINHVPYTILDIKLPWSQSALTSHQVKVPLDRDLKNKKIPSTYVPARNLVFLGYAVSCAESMGASAIFIGAHTLDYSGYPDCRPGFLSSFERTANEAVHKKGIKIIAPLVDKNKKEIIEMGLSLGVPFEHTWSCYKGGARPCGHCDSCRFRIEAFKRLGRTDPVMVHPAPGKSSAKQTSRSARKSGSGKKKSYWRKRKSSPQQTDESENSGIF